VVYVSKKVDLQEGDATSSIVQRSQLVYISETYLFMKPITKDLELQMDVSIHSNCLTIKMITYIHLQFQIFGNWFYETSLKNINGLSFLYN
jgi:CRISPR/Cas system CSM-associated protein Csm4 (group 5 of RAMP superfamily)